MFGFGRKAHGTEGSKCGHAGISLCLVNGLIWAELCSTIGLVGVVRFLGEEPKFVLFEVRYFWVRSTTRSRQKNLQRPIAR